MALPKLHRSGMVIATPTIPFPPPMVMDTFTVDQVTNLLRKEGLLEKVLDTLAGK